MTTPTVEYRDIEGFPGYRVGDDGSVWSRWTVGGKASPVGEWRPLKPLRTGRRRNYFTVQLCQARKPVYRYIHRLVLQNFVGPCPDGMECCHADGDPANNRLANLRWDTGKANQADRVTHETDQRGERNASAKLTEAHVRQIRSEYRPGYGSLARLARRYSVTPGAILAIVKRLTWKHVA